MPVLTETEKIKLAKMSVSCSAFYQASSLLIKNYHGDVNQQFPIIANATFTSEIALKVMIANTKGCFVHGHNLYALFAELDEEYQNLILDTLKTVFYPQATHEQLLDNIKAVSDAFKKVRYMGEYTFAIDWTFCVRLMMTLYCINKESFTSFRFVPVDKQQEIDLTEVEKDVNEAIKKAVLESEAEARNEQKKLRRKHK